MKTVLISSIFLVVLVVFLQDGVNGKEPPCFDIPKVTQAVIGMKDKSEEAVKKVLLDNLKNPKKKDPLLAVYEKCKAKNPDVNTWADCATPDVVKLCPEVKMLLASKKMG